ncbi:MAG: hypothetical protein JWM68_4535 [Verrucomicrobiales bacterium]|nr:hypothetical protein [Verrucomicrobiales bacterium]
MKIPKFEVSEYYLDEIELTCLVAKVPSGSVPKLGSVVSKKRKDSVFEVYVRGKESKKLSQWSTQMLQRLFQKEELLVAVEKGMKEYDTSGEFEGYDKKADAYKEIKRNGIFGLLALERIVLDDIKKQVIICLSTIADMNLEEHGINIYLESGQWRFEHGDYIIEYLNSIQSDNVPVVEFQLENDHTTAVTHTTDALYGVWEFDEKGTVSLLSRLGRSKFDIQQVIYALPLLQYKISKSRLEFRTNASNAMALQCVSVEFKGAHVILKLRHSSSPQVLTWNLYLQNNLLLDPERGVALKKRIG